MSTSPEDQLQRASEGEEATAEAPSAESKNGEAARRGRRSVRRAARAAAAEEATGETRDGTQVSSDASAPAPPKRRRFAKTTDEGTVATPAPEPITEAEPAAKAAPQTAPKAAPKARKKREPVTYSTAHAEAEAVLLDDAREPEVPSPAPSALTVATAAPYSGRRVRQTITKVDLWSVTKLSLCFYISSMFVMIVALIALWLIADAAGIIHSVENFLGDLLEAKDFTFLSGDVLRGTILVGLVVVALQVVLTVIAASFYNIFAELFGGLEISVKEEEELR